MPKTNKNLNISPKLKKKIEDEFKDKAKNLAYKISDELVGKYNSLIGDYYEDKPESKYYKRTKNLFNSSNSYFREDKSNSIYYGGVDINASRMEDYESIMGEPGNHDFDAERLLYKYVYAHPTSEDSNGPFATWHGGDWHGGYGQLANFSIYEEMIKYRDNIIKDLNRR